MHDRRTKFHFLTWQKEMGKLLWILLVEGAFAALCVCVLGMQNVERRETLKFFSQLGFGFLT